VPVADHQEATLRHMHPQGSLIGVTMKNNKPDKPTEMQTKVVNLLDVTPARADAPAPGGEKITIITLEHNGEIEHPMMFNLRDSRKLAIELLKVLAHHGDEKAEKAHQEYVGETEGRDGS
jgi:hypothetical protein